MKMKKLMEGWNKYKVRLKEESDLKTWMSKTLQDLPSPPIADLDAQAAQEIVQGAEKYDGSQQDDTQMRYEISGDLDFSNLNASQNEIGAAQSLRNTMAGVDGTEWDGIDWGDPEWLTAQMKSANPTFTFNSPIVVAQTADGFVVLDGHHRWSQAMMINPKGKINVQGFNAENLSADDVLQALHLGIYAVSGQAGVKSAKGGNLFAAGEQDIKAYMDSSERKVNPATFEPDPNGVAPYIAAYMRAFGIEDPADGETGAKAYAKSAIASIADSIVPGAPARTKMPQTDVEVNPGASPAAVAQALKTGDVNYAPPFDKKGDQQPPAEPQPEAEQQPEERKKRVAERKRVDRKNLKKVILKEIRKYEKIRS